MQQNEELVQKCNSLIAKLEQKILTDQRRQSNDIETIQHVDAVASDRLSKVKQKIAASKTKIDMFEDDIEVEKKTDAALIQCFFGVDMKRIAATTKALQCMLKTKQKLVDWVFVESQSSRSKAAFGWLSSYGIKYVFVKCPKRSEGLFLKPSLWNIGATKTNAKKLLFVDSDVMFYLDTWTDSASKALDNYDVISVHGWSRYSDLSAEDTFAESIGHLVERTSNKEFYGHIGFTVGMTRAAYQMIDRFDDCSTRHSDNVFWQKIFGTANRKPQLGWCPYKPDNSYTTRFGLPLSVGSTEEACCHVDHGAFAERNYAANALATWHISKEPSSEMTFNKKTQLPEWADNIQGEIVKDICKRLEHSNASDDIIFQAMQKHLGKIDDDNPLFVVTMFKPSFALTAESIVAQYNAFAKTCNAQFTYVCFVNSDKKTFDKIALQVKNMSEDIDLVQSRSLDIDEELKRKDVTFQKNANLLICDIDFIPTKTFTLCNCDDDVSCLSLYDELSCCRYIKASR